MMTIGLRYNCDGAVLVMLVVVMVTSSHIASIWLSIGSVWEMALFADWASSTSKTIGTWSQLDNDQDDFPDTGQSYCCPNARILYECLQ